jgi:hypothetical protein
MGFEKVSEQSVHFSVEIKLRTQRYNEFILKSNFPADCYP